MGNRTSMLDNLGQMAVSSLDAINQIEADFYLPLATGLSWATMSLGQWDALTLSAWDGLPRNSSRLLTGSNATVYDAAGNRLLHIDEVTSDVMTYTDDDANRLLTAEDASGVTTIPTTPVAIV